MGQASRRPPLPKALSVSRAKAGAHCMRQSSGPGACSHAVPSVGLVPLPSVCGVSCLSPLCSWEDCRLGLGSPTHHRGL